MKIKNVGKWSFVLVLAMIFIQACSVNRAEIDDSLKKHFDENSVDGCFALLDNASGKIKVYNLNLDTQRFLPASTFKIANALIGLQTGIITNDTMQIKWDGVVRSNPDWNKDMGMREAFKVSCVPYFQEVARRIGRDTMQRWIDSMGYGNRAIGAAIDSFWLNNSIRISPDEQLGLMKRLYFDQLPFRKSVQQQVRDAMLQEENTAYKLSYKTGWGTSDDNNQIGWQTGWIEENKHVYFFVSLIKTSNKEIDMKKVRDNITRGILKELGFFEGKK